MGFSNEFSTLPSTIDKISLSLDDVKYDTVFNTLLAALILYEKKKSVDVKHYSGIIHFTITQEHSIA